MKDNKLINYKFSKECPASKEFNVKVNGEEVFVYEDSVAYFATVSFEGQIEVEITTTRNIENVIVRPLSCNIKPEINKEKISFELVEPRNLFIEVNNQKMPLFLFANPIEKEVPNPESTDVLYFKAGAIYEVGTLTLQSNQTVYIEGGAVVRGVIRATEVTNVRVLGRGILDGKLESSDGKNRRHFVVFEGCNNIYMEGIILIEPPNWMLVLGACDGVNIVNVKEIGQCPSSDGIDIVGSKNVVIDGVFIRNNDDCIAIKAMDDREKPQNAKVDWTGNVDNILVKNSVFYTSEECGGNALEIGFELRTDTIENVVFENNDIIAVHGFGSVFAIHLGDRAMIRNIKYENIRIEHFFDKLVDFRILHSPMWNLDARKGQIRDIYFKNIQARVHSFNSGYTNSLIGGYTPENTIERVTFEDFYLGDKKAASVDDIWLHTKHAFDIEFK